MLPWSEIATDLIGPWTLDIVGQEIQFSALTIIDMVTNLVELVQIENKTSADIAQLFNNAWLARYPRPQRCIHDQGGEFTGWPFQALLHQHGILDRPTTAKNPQANAICERMHQSVGNTLRALTTLNPPAGIMTAEQLVDTALAKCMYATRAAFHGGLQTSPGALVFQHDRVLDLPLIADLQLIQERHQQLIDERLIKANRRCFSHDYAIGDEVLKLEFKPKKLQPRATGPYRVVQVHANGTVTIRLTPHTIERISIRRIKPYHR